MQARRRGVREHHQVVVGPSGAFQVNLVERLKRARRPYYNLMMFPYTSAAGLHAGNMFSYIGSDAHGRWMAMRGYDVFEPIGFDAFGVHTENYAIKTGIQDRKS